MSLSVMLQQLASGMVVSVEIFVVTLLFSLPLGLLICFGRMSKNPAIRGIQQSPDIFQNHPAAGDQENPSICDK